MKAKSYSKIFIIDTNVFIHRPDAILSFHDSEVVVPLWVLEELDKLKTYSDERGRNARHAIRFLEERAQKGRLSEGVKIEQGSLLRVSLDYDHELVEVRQDRTDNKIILSALTIQKAAELSGEGKQVFFVSKDINARVKARALGLYAVDYEKQKTSIAKLYSGFRLSSVDADSIATLREQGTLPWKETLLANEFVLLSSAKQDEAVARYEPDAGTVRKIGAYKRGVAGIHPLNAQQQMAFDLLLDDTVSLVSLVGKAGTGKTLLALAAGLSKVFESESYGRMLASRPVMPLGKDIGFLPGDKGEKLSHWMKPLYDNLELIASQSRNADFKHVETLLKSEKIEIEAITYIRGRSLPKQYIIIDEAQNLTPHEIKTIVSRAGRDTKVVLTGDPYQIDTPYLDSDSNGLTFLVEAFKGQRLFGHVTLEKSERSQLAELAAELL
ncbi:MAG: PhoH family protein [Spirochaetota bacterium]